MANASDTTARPWWLIGDDRGLYLCVDWANAGYAVGYAFGDIASFKSGDAYACLIAGHSASAPANMGANQGFSYCDDATTTGQYLARSYTQVGGAVAHAKRAYITAEMGRGGYAFPSPVDNGLHLAPVYLTETSARRGAARGLYAPLHATYGVAETGDITIQSPDNLAGRTLMAIALACSGPQKGNCWLDITGPW